MSDSSYPKSVLIAAQSFKDATLKAEFEFRVVLGSSEPYRLSVKFDGSSEIREYRFDENGLKSGSGTKMVAAPELPSPLRLVK